MFNALPEVFDFLPTIYSIDNYINMKYKLFIFNKFYSHFRKLW